MGAGVIFVEGDGFLVGAPGIIPLVQPGAGVADLHVDAGQARVHGFRGEDGLERAVEIAARELDPRPEKPRGGGVGFLFIPDRDEQPLRLREVTALEITGGEEREETLLPGPPPHNLLEQEARWFRFASLFQSSVRATLYFASISADSAAF